MYFLVFYICYRTINVLPFIGFLTEIPLGNYMYGYYITVNSLIKT